ncbi:MAG: glycosyltransferase family 4 protein [Desulfobacter sp.]|nr:MAG: glycosyltransferase family 4 protein [Desulfobacter sp.]
MNKSTKGILKFCYIKPGDVAAELVSIDETSSTVTGGQLYYIHSIYRLMERRGSLLLLSWGKSTKKVKRKHCVAKTLTIKTNPKFLNICRRIVFPFLVGFELLKFKPDYILCARGSSLLVCYVVSMLIRSKLIVSLHSDLSVGRRFDRLFELLILKRCHFVVAHGPFLYRQLCKIRRKGMIEYIASFDDFSKINCFEESVQSGLPSCINDKEKKLLFYVGRMEPGKGVYDLYDAFKAVNRQIKSLVMVYAGGGSCCKPLQKAIEADGLKGEVFILGEKSRVEVAYLFKKSWVAINPTRIAMSEGLCKSAIEAFILGVPVIAPEVGAFRYVIDDDKNGLLYKPDSIVDLEHKIRHVMNPEIRAKLAANALAKGRILCSDKLSFEEAVKQGFYSHKVKYE